MYAKISSNFVKIENYTENISLLMNNNESIENFQVIDEKKILITVKKNNQLIGLIYDINNKKIIQELTK